MRVQRLETSLSFGYVRLFIARLAQHNPDQAKVAKVTEVLQEKAPGSGFARIRSGPVNEQTAAVSSSAIRWQDC